MKIGIFIIAYEAVETLISAYERIPEYIKEMAEEVYVIDDCSDDNTYYAGLGYKYHHGIEKLKVYRNEKNLRYGGNQKRGYQYAMEKGFDIVVMVHGDVQYAPEKIPDLINPLLNKEAEVVMGSRMMGNPLAGGMPIWKYLANRALTVIENCVLGLSLSEYHSGFRAYAVDALRAIPLSECTDEFHFDTEILIQLKQKGFRIKEVPIPTHYGPESHKVGFLESVKYGCNILKTLAEYLMHTMPLFRISSKKFTA